MRSKVKKNSKHATSVIIWTVVAVVMTFYVLYHLIKGFAPAMLTANAVSTFETHYSTFDAYLIRNDKPIGVGMTGYCDYTVDDGGFISTDKSIANVYESNIAEVAARIAEYDRKIAVLEATPDQEMNLTEKESALDSINSAYRDITAQLASGNTEKALAAKEGLLENMYSLEELNSGSDVSAKLEAKKQKLAELKEARAAECRKLGGYTTVMSSETGNFFRSDTGSCRVYSCENISDIGLFELQDLLAVQPTESGGIGSFMNLGVEWYIAVPTDMSIASGFVVGRTYTVDFGGEAATSVAAKLVRRVTSSDTPDAILIFSCDRIIPGFDWTAVQKVNIVTKQVSGYRVVNEAIRTLNGQKGVWVLSGGRITWRTLTVIYDNGIYSVVEPQSSLAEEFDARAINHNDTYIVSGNQLYEGKLVN